MKDVIIYLLGATGFILFVFAIMIAESTMLWSSIFAAVAVIVSIPMIIKEGARNER